MYKSFLVLLNPRNTIRKVVDTYPNTNLWLLSSIHGFICLFNFFQSLSLGLYFSTSFLVLLSIVFAPIIGYLLISFGAWLIKVSGSWINLKGQFLSIRACYAYSQVPLIGYVLAELILLFFFGKRVFVYFPEFQEFVLREIFIFYSAMLLEILFVIWSLVILIAMLKEIRQTSVGKVILNLLIAFALYVLIVFLVTLPFIDQCSHFFHYPEVP